MENQRESKMDSEMGFGLDLEGMQGFYNKSRQNMGRQDASKGYQQPFRDNLGWP